MSRVKITETSELLLPYLKMVRPSSEGEERGGSLVWPEWVAGRSFLIYGVRVGIRTNEPGVLDRLFDRLPPLWKPSAIPLVEHLFSLQVGKTRHALFDGQEQAIKSRSLESVLEVFERRLKMAVAEMARRRVFIHAGAVGWQGKAIIIPGQTMSGKTSLVAELVRAGATYYSDEYAVLDEQGRVHPYPQPLAVRRTARSKQKKVAVEEIGGVMGRKPLPVGLVIVTSYQPGADWCPTELSAGQGALKLLANTVPARRKPEIVLPVLQKAVAVARIQLGERGEAAETARLILQTERFQERQN